jgi:hypothetical protein
LSDRQIDRQYDVELVLRFFFLVETDNLKASELRDFSAVLDDYGIALAEEFPSPRTRRLGHALVQTLDLIEHSGGSDFFRRFYPEEDRFKGPFLNTSFEALASGIGYHVFRGQPVAPDLMKKARDFWSSDELGLASQPAEAPSGGWPHTSRSAASLWLPRSQANIKVSGYAMS